MDTYELRVRELTLGSGKTVANGDTTGRIQPGENVTITSRWETPTGTAPHSVTVVAVSAEDGSATPRTITKRVHLAKIPVRGD